MRRISWRRTVERFSPFLTLFEIQIQIQICTNTNTNTNTNTKTKAKTGASVAREDEKDQLEEDS